MTFLKIEQEELHAIGNRLLGGFVDRRPPFEIFTELNEAFLQATNSEYGFIARVFRNQDGPYIKTLALSNIAWNDETRRLYSENAERGMVFDNVNSIFGQVLKTGRIYISHDAPNDPNKSGIPVGHPRLERFLGIPVVRNEVLIGMVGLANGDDYCEPLVDELEKLTTLTSHIMYATGLQQDFMPDGNYFRRSQAIINSFRSGVLSIDEYGIVSDANPAAAMIFGYEPEEILGAKIQSLIPPTGEEPFYDVNGNLSLKNAVVTEPFEATGTKKEGSFFPVEVSADVVNASGKLTATFVIRDITEAKKNERQKNEFISIVSHELRTPLTAAHSALSMLVNEKDCPVSPQVRAELLQMAHRNCDRLARLVDDILDYEKLNIGKIDFEFAREDLDAIVTPVLQTTSILANLSDIKLDFILPEQPIQVLADGMRIARVLINLVTNAIRVSDSGSVVQLEVEHDVSESMIRFSVTDEGPGIPPENLKLIFDPFKQFDESPGSAGLGLAICKAIVDKHESRIQCESEIGKGTKFYFDLIEYCEVNPTVILGGHRSDRNIVWLEQDLQQFELAVANLTHPRLNFHWAGNAQIAKKRLNEKPIDLMLLGHPVAMESTDQLVQEIRGCDELKDLPIIVYSNGLSNSFEQKLKGMKVECTIKRSWNAQELNQRVMDLLGVEAL